MGDAQKIRIGPCEVFYGDIDNPQSLGYTVGGVNVKYSSDTVTLYEDQKMLPIREHVVRQKCSITTKLAEYDLEKFSKLIPNANFGTTLNLNGNIYSYDYNNLDCLILKDLRSNEFVTFYNVVPKLSLNAKYENNLRSYEVSFKAVGNNNGFVKFWNLPDADYYYVNDLQFLTTESGDMLIGE
jgi:hypothetical protein